MNPVRAVCLLFIASILGVIGSCKPETILEGDQWVYAPEPYVIEQPLGLPAMQPAPADNPSTVQGVALGRKLFYDPILSADNSLSCAGCHAQNTGFTDDGNTVSIGIDGIAGKRNAMPIFNLGYLPSNINIGLFWDGRSPNLEMQALIPIEDPIEMHDLLPNVVNKLKATAIYEQLFCDAFGTKEITPILIGKALAQFERSIVSGNTKFDQAINAVSGVFLTEEEALGFQLFNALDGGDCFHCHGSNAGLFTDFQFRNNGLDDASIFSDFEDPGLGIITGVTTDYGRFKTPSLRNVALTAPYMHDGRFATLEEVLEHYNSNVKNNDFTDPFMQFKFQNGVQLGPDSVAAIIAFLHTLTDSSLLTNTNYSDPN